MGKTRDTGKLATQIQFDNNNNLIIGSSPSSILDISGSIEAVSITGSFTGSVYGIGNVVSFSSSISSDLVSIHGVTASNISRLNSIEEKTGSLATTGSNTFYGQQVFSGSLYVQSDLIVQGSSSLQNITASAVSIGTNIVNLNTANPAVRYAGISVQDSGSANGVTGSLLWDSTCNRWIYSNPSGVGYSGGIIMSGPRAETFGQETTLTCNYVAKSGGGDHLYDSCIYESSGSVGINTNNPGGQLDVKTGACSNIVFTGDCANVSAINSYSTTNGFQTLKYAAGTHMFFAGATGGGSMSEVMRITCCGTMIVGYNKAGISDSLQRTITLGGRPDAQHIVSLGFDSNCTYRADLDFNGNTGKFEFYNYSGSWGASPKLLIDINGVACFSSRICSPSLTTCNLRLSDETTFGLTICKGPSVYPIIISDGGQSMGFYTCESGGGFAERLKIWQNGIISVGCHICLGTGADTPVNPNKGIYLSNNGTTALIIRDSSNDSEFTTQVQSNGTIFGTLTNHDLITYVNNAEASRLQNGGNIYYAGTGGFGIHKGTTAQRPSACTGMMRYNTSFNLMEFYNGTTWVQMGSGDLATGFCFNNLSMCHDVYRAAGTLGLQGQGSGCISLYGAAAPSMPTSNTGNQFATHGGHCGITDYPGYWGVNLGAARAVNQLKVWIHANSWGYFELQGSNNSGNASGFATNGTWTSLSFVCSNSNNCQNMGGNSSGCTDGTIFTFWYTNDVPFQAYRIKVLDSSRPNTALGTYYGGSAGYIWQLNRV